MIARNKREAYSEARCNGSIVELDIDSLSYERNRQVVVDMPAKKDRTRGNILPGLMIIWYNPKVIIPG